MFEGLLETRRGGIEKRRMALLPVVIILQGSILAGFVVSSVWSVSYIEEPPLVVSLVAPPPPPPPAAKKAPPAQKKATQQPVSSEVAPVTIPDYIPESLPPSTNVATGVAGGVEGWGDEEGIEEGVPGGIPGGVPVERPEEQPVRIGINVQGEQPKIISRVQPEYPEIARKARIEGTVILEAVIEKDGSVGEVRILKSLNPLLDQAAVRAAKQWRFEPGKINGKPVRAYFILTVVFKIQ